MLDFRFQNQYCISMQFVEPQRHFTMAILQSFTVGSVFDLTPAFHQMPISQHLHDVLRFRIGSRYFNICRLSKGQCNTSQLFCRALALTLRRVETVIKGQVINYVDDIILLSSSKKALHRELIRMCHFQRGWFVFST